MSTAPTVRVHGPRSVVLDLAVEDVRAATFGPKLGAQLTGAMGMPEAARARATVVDAALALARRHPTGPGTVRVLLEDGPWRRIYVQVLMTRPPPPLPDPRVLQGATKKRALAKIAIAKKKPPIGKPHASGALVAFDPAHPLRPKKS